MNGAFYIYESFPAHSETVFDRIPSPTIFHLSLCDMNPWQKMRENFAFLQTCRPNAWKTRV